MTRNPAASWYSFTPCLTSSSVSGTILAVGTGTGARAGYPVPPSAGAVTLPARTYCPRPTLASGVPAELAGPPGALRIIPWNVGSRLGRSCSPRG